MPMLVEVENWARFPRSRSIVIPVNSLDQAIPFDSLDASFLPHGMGRSLGDSCLNDGNALLKTNGLDRVIAFDEATGRLVAEGGITFDAILRRVLPKGWFLPVTPGTRFVSLGGATANDVHGKNHHVASTFGRHVVRFQLRRSDGTRLLCSRSENPEWFRATIGGLGLTGLIEWVEVQLKPVENSWIDSETIRYGDLNEFFALNEESIGGYEYVVAWVDTMAVRQPGRGVFIRGNHNRDPKRTERIPPSATSLLRADGLSIQSAQPRNLDGIQYSVLSRQTWQKDRKDGYRAVLLSAGRDWRLSQSLRTRRDDSVAGT